MRWGIKHSFSVFEDRLPCLRRAEIKRYREILPKFSEEYERKFGREKLTRIAFPLIEEAITKYPPKNFQKGYVGESLAAAVVSLFMDESELLIRNLKFFYEFGCGEIDLAIFNGPFLTAIGEVKTGVNGKHKRNLSKVRHIREALGLSVDREEISILSRISLSVANIEGMTKISPVRIDLGPNKIEIYIMYMAKLFSVGPWDACSESNPTIKIPIHSSGIGILADELKML
ncbi:MAG: hypothetical protein QXD51_03810 [Candidatus Anstonellales archaeon]